MAHNRLGPAALKNAFIGFLAVFFIAGALHHAARADAPNYPYNIIPGGPIHKPATEQPAAPSGSASQPQPYAEPVPLAPAWSQAPAPALAPATPGRPQTPTPKKP